MFLDMHRLNLMIVIDKDLFEKFNEDNSRVEMEENGQGKCDPLNDDPRHESVETCLHDVRPYLLDLEGDDEPLGHVEHEEEHRDLPSWFSKFWAIGKNLKFNKT
jgi:hypothetical protein